MSIRDQITSLVVQEFRLHAADTSGAVARIVASWRPLKHYAPRITESSKSSSLHYRLAVTESGINNAKAGPHQASGTAIRENGTALSLRLLWIGLPLATYAGLMVLLGHDEGHDRYTADANEWPLP